MHTSSILLLVVAAGVVAVLHSILPDHWVPLAVVARTQRWSVLHVARVSALASAGHVVTSVILAGAIAVAGLAFQQQIETQQGHIVGAVLALTGLGFLIWALAGRGHSHDHDHGQSRSILSNDLPLWPDGQSIKSDLPPLGANRHTHDHGDQHAHDHHGAHDHASHPAAREGTLARRLAAIAVPFGVAASPDLTILPVALAAGALGWAVVSGVLVVFTVLTMSTFIGLTVLATLAGYQIKGKWLEDHATTITALVLIAIGAVAYTGF